MRYLIFVEELVIMDSFKTIDKSKMINLRNDKSQTNYAKNIE